MHWLVHGRRTLTGIELELKVLLESDSILVFGPVGETQCLIIFKGKSFLIETANYQLITSRFRYWLKEKNFNYKAMICHSGSLLEGVRSLFFENWLLAILKLLRIFNFKQMKSAMYWNGQALPKQWKITMR